MFVASIQARGPTLESVLDSPPVAPAAWTPLDLAGPFLARLVRGEELLRLVSRLFSAGCLDEFQEALEAVLATLGLERLVVDETARLSSNKVLRRLTTLARSGRFVVSLVETSYPLRHASTYDPVFRIHPNGVVFAYAPEFQASAVAFLAPRGDAGGRVRQRVLVGKGKSLDPLDNLATWCWRLDGLRGRFHDDVHALEARARRRLAASMSAVDRAWRSAPVPGDTPPPGLAWEESFAWYQRGFFEAAAGGWVWGLERVLRNTFPIIGRECGGSVDYRGFTLIGEPRLSRVSLDPRRQRAQRVRIDLVARLADGSQTPESISVDIPTIDDAGCFLVDGVSYRFAPRLDPNGGLVYVAREEVKRRAIGRSASLGSFLEQLVARPLALMAFNASRARVDPSGGHVPIMSRLRRAMRHARGPWGVPLLASKAFLSSELPRASATTRRIVAPTIGQSADLEDLPPWACPEIGRALPAGTHLPVACARMTPSGGLALPERVSPNSLRWRVQEGSALAVNPRWGGDSPGPRRWWICSQLRELAGMRGGDIPDPTTIAESCSQWRTLRVVRRCGPELRAWVRPRVLTGESQRSTIVETIPARHGETLPPELLAEEGMRLSQGSAWLRLSSPSAGVPRVTETTRLLSVVSPEFCIRNGESLRMLPPGVDGVVLGAHIEPLREFGEVVGWLATIRLGRPALPSLPEFLIFADGHVVRCVDVLAPRDEPIVCLEEEGAEVDVLLEVPLYATGSDDSIQFIDPWEAVESVADERVFVVPGEQPEIEGPDWSLRARVRDGEYRPASANAPGLAARERLWWFLRDPRSYSEVAVREALWFGGVPPWIPRLRDALAAAGLPRLGASDPEPEAVQLRDLRPVRTVGGRVRSPLRRGSAVHWSCACGGLSRPRNAFDRCLECSAVVLPTTFPVDRHRERRFPARHSVIHPWARSSVAEALGLDAEALDDWLDERAIAEAHASIRGALPSSEAERATFLDLADTVILHDALACIGEVGGITGDVQGPLMRAYVDLAEQLRRAGSLASVPFAPPWITEMQGRSIQRQVDALFGPRSAGLHAKEPTSLAEALVRILPWTRAPGLRSSPPGVLRLRRLRVVSPDDDSADEVRTIRCLRPLGLADPSQPQDPPTEDSDLGLEREVEVCVSNHAVHRSTTGVLLDDGIRLLPRRPSIAGDWSDPSTWRRRRDLEWFMREGLRLFAAIAWSGDIGGQHALSILLAHLTGHSDPRPLRALLDGRLPRPLPHDPAAARMLLIEPLELAFPGTSAALRGALAWFSEQLAGWWWFGASKDAPRGWRWWPLDHVPEGGRRQLPTIRSDAWKELDAWALLHQPAAWFFRDPVRAEPAQWPRIVRIASGLAPWPEELAIDTVPSPEAVSEPTPLVADVALGDTEIRVSPTSGPAARPATVADAPDIDILPSFLEWLRQLP